MLVCLSVWPASVSLKAYVTVCHFQALITKTLTGNAAEAAFLPWLLRHQPVKTECHLLPLQPTAEGEDGTSTSQGLISKHRKSWGTVWCCEVLLFSEGHRCGGLDQSETDWDRGLQTSEISSFVMVFREAAVVPCCLKWQEVSFVTLKEPFW